MSGGCWLFFDRFLRRFFVGWWVGRFVTGRCAQGGGDGFADDVAVTGLGFGFGVGEEGPDLGDGGCREEQGGEERLGGFAAHPAGVGVGECDGGVLLGVPVEAFLGLA